MVEDGQFRFYKTQYSQEEIFDFRSILPFEIEGNLSNKLDEQTPSSDYVDVTSQSFMMKSLAAAIREKRQSKDSRNERGRKPVALHFSIRPSFNFCSILDTSGKQKIWKRHAGLVTYYVERKSLQNIIMGLLKTEVNKSHKYPYNIVNIYGLGGHGKSELAKKIFEIADDESLFDGHLIWMDAGQFEALLNQFKALLPVKPESTTNTSDVLEMFYKDLLKDQKYLIIFNDVTDFEMIEQFLPMNGFNFNAKILLTSKTEWKTDGVENVNVSVFGEDEATAFIKKFDRTITPCELEVVLQQTSLIPADWFLLCLRYREYKEAQPTYTWDRHMKAYGSMLSTEMYPKIDGFEKVHNRVSTLANVSLSMELMETNEIGPLAVNLLKYIAFCNPTSISKRYFLHLVPAIRSSAEQYGAVTLKIDLAVRLLKSFGFVRILEETEQHVKDDFFAIQRSYQSALRVIIEEDERKNILQELINWVQLPEVPENDIIDQKHPLALEIWTHIRGDNVLENAACKTRHFLRTLCGCTSLDNIKFFSNVAGQSFVDLLLERPELGSYFFALSGLERAVLVRSVPILMMLFKAVEDKLKQLKQQPEQNRMAIEYIQNQMLDLALGSIIGSGGLDIIIYNFSFHCPTDVNWFHNLFLHHPDKELISEDTTRPSYKVFKAIFNGPDVSPELKRDIVNRKNNDGLALLDIAVADGRHGVLQFLLEMGATIEAGNYYCIYATIRGLYQEGLERMQNEYDTQNPSDIIQFFDNRGKCRHPDEQFAMISTNQIVESYAKTMKILVKNIKNPRKCNDSDSDTHKVLVLYLALIPQQLLDMDIIKFLLEVGADPNIKIDAKLEITTGENGTKYFPPALHSAMKHDPPNWDLVQQLISYGAEKSIRDSDGKQPSDLLKNWKKSKTFDKDGYKKLKKFLKKKK